MKKVTIYKADGTGVRTSCLITRSSMASFQISSKDEVRIVFSRTEMTPLHIGDYILIGEQRVDAGSYGALASTLAFNLGSDNEDKYVFPERIRTLLAHKYQVTAPYIPSWNDQKRCYDYDVTMSAFYYGWASRVMRLPVKTDNGEIMLGDTDFSVTDQMQTHAYILLLNLKANGLWDNGYDVRIRYNNKRELVVSLDDNGNMTTRDVSYGTSGDDVEYIERTTELVEYSNVDIISAISQIAKSWDCEWWAKGSSVFFGRVDNASTVTDVRTHSEASSIIAQSSSGTYATRLYAYGGTRNIPTTYRKSLVFTNSANGKQEGSITDDARLLSYDCFLPSMRSIGKSVTGKISNTEDLSSLYSYCSPGHIIVNDGGFLYGGEDDVTTPAECRRLFAQTGKTVLFAYKPGKDMQDMDPVKYSLNNLWLISTEKETAVEVTWSMNGEVICKGTVTSIGNEYIDGYTRTTTGLYRNGGIYLHTIQNVIETNATAKASDDMHVSITPYKAVPVWLDASNIVLTDASVSVTNIPVMFLRNYAGEIHALHDVTLKARFNNTKASNYSIEARQLVVLKQDNASADLSQIAFGDTYTIGESCLVKSRIRAAYWTKDTQSVASNNIKDVRLMLPGSLGYVDAADGLSEADIVETVKIFDDIYPSRTDTITSVRTYSYESEETDGVTGEITKQPWNAYQFKAKLASADFSNDYKLQTGEQLCVTFATGLLSGMTFEVVYNPTHAGESAKPEVNPDGTRNEEATWFEIVRNEDYGTGLPNDTLRPSSGDTFTLYNYDTSYISSSLLPQAEDRLLARAKSYLTKLTHNDSTYLATLKAGWLRESGWWFALGDRVRIDTASRIDPVRDERIIGYSIHLDCPEDAPQITVGENARYSRLESIEKLAKETRK